MGLFGAIDGAQTKRRQHTASSDNDLKREAYLAARQGEAGSRPHTTDKASRPQTALLGNHNTKTCMEDVDTMMSADVSVRSVEYRAIFARYDIDGSGNMSAHELEGALANMGMKGVYCLP